MNLTWIPPTARNNTALWLGPFLLWGVLRIDSWGDPYGIGEAAKVSTFLIVIAPIVAVSSAVNSWRLRPALEATRYRSAWVTLLPGTATSALVGIIVLSLGATIRAGAPLAWLHVLAPTLVAVGAWSAIGTMIGLLLGPLIGWPLAVLSPFLLITQSAAMGDPRLRHLTGSWFGCCLPNRTLAPDMILATSAVWLSVLILGVVAVWAWDRLAPRRLAIICVVVAIGLVALTFWQALITAGQFTWSPTIARTEQRICAPLNRETELCVWPEHAYNLTRPGLSAAAQQWAEDGINLPRTIDEGAQGPSSTVVPALIDPRLSDQWAVMALAESVSKWAACGTVVGDSPDGSPNKSGVDRSLTVQAWLSIRAGMNASTVISDIGLQSPATNDLSRLQTENPLDAAAVINSWFAECPR